MAPSHARPHMGDDAPQLAAAAASAAVAAGALLAGAVLKRSEWLKHWNPRFAVLTTEQLYYYHSASPTGGVGERRSILLTAGMTVRACDGGLFLSCVPPFHFRCSSDAELRVRMPMWKRATQAARPARPTKLRAPPRPRPTLASWAGMLWLAGHTGLWCPHRCGHSS